MKKTEALYRITLNCSQCGANFGQRKVEYARKILTIGISLFVGCKDCREFLELQTPNRYSWNVAVKGSLVVYVEII